MPPTTPFSTHARALGAIADSTIGIDAIGISMDDQIGQAIARREPDLLDRLVLANSGCRLSDRGHGIVDRFERYAREHD